MCRAPVRPRIRSPFSGEAVLLEDLVQDLLAEGRSGYLRLCGGAGAGKTTALAHLEAALDGSPWHVVRGEGAEEIHVGEEGREARLVIGRGEPDPSHPGDLTLDVPLVPWGADEVLEYLQTKHPVTCGDVMRRVLASEHHSLLWGVPAVWAVVLDRMGADSRVSSVEDALRAHVSACDVEDPATRRQIVDRLADGMGALTRAEMLSETWERLLRTYPTFAIPVVQEAWLAVTLADALAHGDPSLLVIQRYLSGAVVALTACYLKDEAAAFRCLRDALAHGDEHSHPVAASLLHALEPRWLRDAVVRRADASTSLSLERAYLPAFDGRGLNLERLRAPRARLPGADLRGASLRGVNLDHVDLSQARLDQADFTDVRAVAACLRGACLSGACLRGARLMEADLSGCVLDDASFEKAALQDADLRDVRACGTNFAAVDLSRTRLEGACLHGACFDRARLVGVDLRECDCVDTTFRGADLSAARMSGLSVRGLVLTRARLYLTDLTGARLAAARLAHSILRHAFLANVDLEGADLRGVDLRRAVFHLGSSRSGLVFSPIASEGSRTGFYTEDDRPYDFKAPEEIRKANLRGTDLRGALLEGTDFYLVDVREARFSAGQREYLRRCGAILE